jgi:hypothetical protein
MTSPGLSKINEAYIEYGIEGGPLTEYALREGTELETDFLD